MGIDEVQKQIVIGTNLCLLNIFWGTPQGIYFAMMGILRTVTVGRETVFGGGHGDFTFLLGNLVFLEMSGSETATCIKPVPSTSDSVLVDHFQTLKFELSRT